MHSYPPQLLPYSRFISPPALPRKYLHTQTSSETPNQYTPFASMACINTFQSCSFARGAKISTRTRTGAGRGSAGSPTFQCRASTFMDASLRLEIDENPDAIIYGEWPENVYLLSYDDLRAYLESQEPVQADSQYVTLVGDTMSTPVLVATADQTLEEVQCHFEAVSGLPVVDGSLRCVGVVVKNDQARASHGSKTKIAEVMTSPAITLSSDKTVMDAAVLMLKMKIHRLPIVNQDEQVIGIVTRADVLRELEGLLKM